jgi:hypothetical protein
LSISSHALPLASAKEPEGKWPRARWRGVAPFQGRASKVRKQGSSAIFSTCGSSFSHQNPPEIERTSENRALLHLGSPALPGCRDPAGPAPRVRSATLGFGIQPLRGRRCMIDLSTTFSAGPRKRRCSSSGHRVARSATSIAESAIAGSPGFQDPSGAEAATIRVRCRRP